MRGFFLYFVGIFQPPKILNMPDSQQLIYLPSLNLLEADYNPRLLTNKEAYDLTASLLLFGMVDGLVVNQHPQRNHVIVGGHQRRRLANKIFAEGVQAGHYIDEMGNQQLYPADHPLEGQPMVHAPGYVVPGCGLSDAGTLLIPCQPVCLPLGREKELNLRLNKNGGRFDFDVLANNFDNAMLFDVGFTPFELGLGGPAAEPTEKVKDLGEAAEPAPSDGSVPLYAPFIRIEFNNVSDLQAVEADLQEVLDRLLEDNPVVLQVNLGMRKHEEAA